MKLPLLLLARFDDAKQNLTSAIDILDDPEVDLQQMKMAATQATQATKTLNQLVGALEYQRNTEGK